MGFIWHFVDLTDSQKHQRRRLLDRYAIIAQVSVFVPILLIQLYFLALWIHARSVKNDDLGIPSSPKRKEARSRRYPTLARARRTLQLLEWWAGEPIEILGSFIATRGEVAGAAVWTAWLLVLCVLQTGDDYLHLTKRFGIVAASQLPLQYLLSFKSPFSPLQLATRLSWESLNRLHQLLGRITAILLYLHAAFYINFYILSGLLSKKLKDPVVILGLLGIIAFTAVGTTALSWIRKLNYRIFYITHTVLATILLPVLFFHVSHIRIYIYETVAVYAFHTLLRYKGTSTYTATITQLPGTDMLDISIIAPSPFSTSTISLISRLVPRDWDYQPGQHAYISLSPPIRKSRFSFSTAVVHTLSANPFTVASIPAVDGRLTLIARIHDGNTRLLAQRAHAHSSSNPSSDTVQLRLEGPYGLPSHSLHLLTYDRVLFVAGGVGATFILPLYRTLLRDLSPSPGSPRRSKVGFVWAVRRMEDMGWALQAPATTSVSNTTGTAPFLNGTANGAVTGAEGDEFTGGASSTSPAEKETNGIKERMEVYITDPSATDPHNTTTSSSGTTGDKAFTIGNDDDDDEADRGITEDGVEMERLLPPSSSISHDDVKAESKFVPGLSVQYGRPDLRAVVQSTFAYGEGERVAVFVCGPVGMTRLLRKEVGRHVRAGREVWFWDEAFGI